MEDWGAKYDFKKRFTIAPPSVQMEMFQRTPDNTSNGIASRSMVVCSNKKDNIYGSYHPSLYLNASTRCGVPFSPLLSIGFTSGCWCKEDSDGKINRIKIWFRMIVHAVVVSVRPTRHKVGTYHPAIGRFCSTTKSHSDQHQCNADGVSWVEFIMTSTYCSGW